MAFTPTDPFDSLLNASCDILAPSAVKDEAGQFTGEPTVLATVPARLAVGRGKVKEFKSEKRFGVSYKTIYMRPYAGLTIHHDLRIAGKRYDILVVDDPGGMGHHFECTVVAIDE